MVETFSGDPTNSSLVQTLSFVAEDGQRSSPIWRTEPLPRLRNAAPDVTHREGRKRAYGTVVVWMPEHIAQACLDEVNDKLPLESDGTLCVGGQMPTGSHDCHFGLGRDAFHGGHSFQPDQMWQPDQIAQHYVASGRRETYLGDWLPEVMQFPAIGPDAPEDAEADE